VKTYQRIRPQLEVGFVVLAVVILLAWPWLAEVVTSNPRFYTSLLATVGIMAILTISLNIAMGYSGLLSIVHTGLLAFGGYTSGVLALRLELPVWLALLAAILLTAALGALIAAVSLRAAYLYFGMITLSFNLLIIEIAREWDEVTGGFFGLVGIPRPTAFGSPLTPRAMYLVIMIALVCSYVFQRNVIMAKPGRAFQAVRESPEAAAALGIRSGPTKVVAFTLSGGLAGLAGSLFAHQLGFINPDVGLLDNALVVFVGPAPRRSWHVDGAAVRRRHGHRHRPVHPRPRPVPPADPRLILLVIMLVVPKGIVGSWRSSRFGADPESDIDEVIEPSVTARGSDDTIEEAALDAVREAGEPVIEVQGITKSFGGIRALAGVDLTVRAREIHGVIGPNGSGKSTLMNCLTGTFPPDAGEVMLFGQPAPKRPWQIAQAGVTRVFQKPHLFERVSVQENVLTGMHMRARQTWVTAWLRLPSFRSEERELRAEALTYLELAGLHDRALRSAAGLSHGQKRLLEVVRAVATKPQVLILDEPATGLTRDELVALGALIRRLRGTGMTVLLIEHNMEFLMGLVDAVTVLESGRVIATGPPAEVQASEEVQTAYLGSGDLLEQYL
jgi:ABC-type branched-subunit amino acid transport system ATPase component/ABC-type branched-subunit amino acid transport system permease subunit